MPVLPHGSWPSPLTAGALAEQAVRLGDTRVDGDTVVWSEGRPGEAGRQALVAAAGRARPRDLLSPPWSALTTVHEYGGGAFALHRGTVFFSSEDDQRLHRLDPGRVPVAITPQPASPGGLRYADASVRPDGRQLVCVRERHLAPGEVVNDLVAVPTDGSEEPTVVAAGRDFYSAPRYSPDGRDLAWLCWDHPAMPWDQTELWSWGGGRVAGGGAESLSQPRWSPDGRLWWLSDRSGWWNLATEGQGAPPPLEAELGGPDWVFGQSTYDFGPGGRVFAALTRSGSSAIVAIDLDTATVSELSADLNAVSSLCRHPDGLAAVAASATSPPAVAIVAGTTGATRTLRSSRPDTLGASYVSVAVPVEFPTTHGRTAHALFYAPRHPHCTGPHDQRPPLVVMSHGGPTSAASPALDHGIQFFTTRGLAVVDVNYGGSSGYGRAYRERLDGQWGVVDVDDCVNAARYLAGEGHVDPDRMVIRGRSAGGYTVLRALTTTEVFAAGASYYGVADLEILASGTHKFESGYLDRLVGPWPEARATYRSRSPVHAAHRLSAPVILLGGTEDRVVPPAQTEALVGVLRANGLPFANLSFDGEAHGFRQAATIRRAAEAELFFYGRVLGFEPADRIEPVLIENL